MLAFSTKKKKNDPIPKPAQSILIWFSHSYDILRYIVSPHFFGDICDQKYMKIQPISPQFKNIF